MIHYVMYNVFTYVLRSHIYYQTVIFAFVSNIIVCLKYFNYRIYCIISIDFLYKMCYYIAINPIGSTVLDSCNGIIFTTQCLT